MVQRSQEGVRAKWTSKKYTQQQPSFSDEQDRAPKKKGEKETDRADHAEVVEVVGETAAAVAVQDGNHASRVGGHVAQAVVAKKGTKNHLSKRKASAACT